MRTDAVALCRNCFEWVRGTHTCENPRPQDHESLPYYYRRREFLAKNEARRYRWYESDNDPASPLEADLEDIDGSIKGAP